jgi:hypothetical protein
VKIAYKFRIFVEFKENFHLLKLVSDKNYLLISNDFHKNKCIIFIHIQRSNVRQNQRLKKWQTIVNIKNYI